ncbi:hypothetical protein TCON_1786 [Astathelohania contejeani]|uniref:Uncharacterized protein n=1 Tax=Astathelohania contejeani TaxID=164912 RepID=A0ABQ7HXW5_9MICR|nr:hypothetical protein TCON_1786 [Thelohania contejeani]
MSDVLISAEENSMLLQAIKTEDTTYIIEFVELDEQAQLIEIASILPEHKISFLKILLKLLQSENKGLGILYTIRMLLKHSEELTYNKEYSGLITQICNTLKEESIAFNKLVYLKGKIDYLIYINNERMEEKKPEIEIDN